MKRYHRLLILVWVLLAGSLSAVAQTSPRKLLRQGNKAYADSAFVEAETNYHKVIDMEPNNAKAHYNLGNAFLWQRKGDEAMKAYETAAKIDDSKSLKGNAHHNMGVVLQSARQYGPAIEAYKEALRNNPGDDEARYNLALCQYLLKNQQQNQDQDQQQDQEKEEKEEQKKQEDKNSEQQQQQEQQEQEMSKENAEQLLNAAKQDEKETQEKIKKAMQQVQRRKLEKQW